ncbi:cytochrome c biogenesis CcdA family protein [Desulfotomaculum copahuensis]|uniref:Cytochrome C biogenesis protein transmembrane domain-containing protein n=1 Tax=Desulfotomaculum copahuensis TaxID=1838280 RepID=A0A1B7LAN8_9FIRM|nr:cytochrome c biogenesis protein CcdA [Desulfotomaculum copahuensis]OAT79407.1 hypothetical protein A6M21_01365 [Desulfotomaculum copahuensis]
MPEMHLSLGMAFLAGLVSFLSPCVLPLIPTYLAYLTGVSAGELTVREAIRSRRAVTINALFFVLGFTLVFVAFGLSASALGKFFIRYQVLLRQISGALLIIFGLHLAGIFQLNWLLREKRVHFVSPAPGLFNSLLMGMAFSAGWTPCTGPVLASILLLAGNSDSLWSGAFLLAVYSLGLGLPFLLAAFSLGWLVQGLRRRAALLNLFTRIGGWLLIIAGILMLTGYFDRLSGYV